MCREVDSQLNANKKTENGKTSQRKSYFHKNIQAATQNIRDHPLKIFDAESAMLVKGVGAKLAQVITQGLFSRYPPSVPTGNEMIQYQRDKKILKKKMVVDDASGATTGAGHRRGTSVEGVGGVSCHGSHSVAVAVATASQCDGAKDMDNSADSYEECEEEVSCRGRDHTGNDGTQNSGRAYIPNLGTANYSFLICLYMAQRGPEKKAYLSKKELMDRAEASGLANKPIYGSSGGSFGYKRNAQSFYSGWSSFKALVNHDLVYSWGNPKKICLTEKGFVLGEKLYVDASGRGKLDDILGCVENPSERQQYTAQHSTDGSAITAYDCNAMIGGGDSAECILDFSLEEMWKSMTSETTSHLPDKQSKDLGNTRTRLDSIDRPMRYHIGRKTLQEGLKCSSSSMGIPHGTLSRNESIRLPPIVMGTSLKEEYDIVLLVDAREQYGRSSGNQGNSRNDSLQLHMDRMTLAGLQVEKRTLPVGDALWIARRKGEGAPEEYALDCILERKSLQDLLSSIKSSDRYHSQKHRLQRCGLKNTFYLVEGDVEALPSATDHKTVCTACAKTSAIDGIRVIRTRNTTETLHQYQLITSAISNMCSKEYDKIATGQEGMPCSTCPTYTEFVKTCNHVDKGMATLKDVWVQMLCEVPGIGPDTAMAVAEVYPTPWLFWRACKTSVEEGKDVKSVLASIPFPSNTRTLGIDASKKICQIFLEMS